MRRGAFFVDPTVQGKLAWKVVVYWLFCLLAMELFVTCWMVLIERPKSSAELFAIMTHGSALPLIASLIMLPVVVIDSIRFSHRVAGPMVRMRRVMKDLAEGRSGQRVSLRDGDFWSEAATDLNRLAARVDALEAELRVLKADVAEAVDEDVAVR